MDENVERRLAAAAEAGERAKQTDEFLRGLTKDDSLVKPIYNPEAWVMREKLQGAAKEGRLPRTECRHPLGSLRQYLDSDPAVLRNDNPVNLFECTVCGTNVWFVDPWGVPVNDR